MHTKSYTVTTKVIRNEQCWQKQYQICQFMIIRLNLIWNSISWKDYAKLISISFKKAKLSNCDHYVTGVHTFMSELNLLKKQNHLKLHYPKVRYACNELVHFCISSLVQASMMNGSYILYIKSAGMPRRSMGITMTLRCWKRSCQCKVYSVNVNYTQVSHDLIHIIQDWINWYRKIW